MRLIAARLERVRQHRLLELNFAPGFTLIGGPNEAGKSTVVEALHKTLFLKATASGRGVEELRSLTHGGLPEVELRFEAAGLQWLLRKRFAGAGGTCQLSSDGGDTLQGSAAETRLASLLQVPGPVEGRRIAQLPLRWAHLWVRQGEAGSDLLAAGGESYDLALLVQQLQGNGNPEEALRATATALESPLDRKVQTLLQQRLDEQLTATGKVRAGSPLALAQTREAEALNALHRGQARLAELEAAMVQLAQISDRLAAIEQQEQALNQLQRLQSEAEPLRQRLQQLLSVQRQQQALQQQRQADQAQHDRLQQQLQQHRLRLEQLEHATAAGRSRRQALERSSKTLAQQQERVSALLDLAALEREQDQLLAHKSRFDALQQQASAIKDQLQQLPAISGAQVRELRQAEQQLAQAEARCQGMATQVELLASTAPVSLDGRPLAVGQPERLDHAAELSLDGGRTRLLISPGGGQAMDTAVAQRQQAQSRLQTLQQQLGQSSSDAAESLAQQRLVLESELANLRKAAATIPWARLDAQLADLEPRRQRLMRALAALGPDARPSSNGLELAALEAEQDTLRQEQQDLAQQQIRQDAELETTARERDQLLQSQGQQQAEAGRLAGSLSANAQQLEQLERAHGSSQQLEQTLGQLREQVERLSEQLAAVESPLQPGGSDPGQTLRLLAAEKETLLTGRGHQEQICRSLGAGDPTAEVELLQAAWEQSQTERQSLERSTAALQLLLQAFATAQQQAANRYCLPLQQALQGYLDALALPAAAAAALQFSPQQGISALQLQQGAVRFDFGQLSGGMREQLNTALRLALADVLLGAYDGCLPLVLDDAFSNSDPTRRAGLLRMLERGVQRGVQVLLFSCTPADFAALAATPGRQLNLPTGHGH